MKKIILFLRLSIAFSLFFILSACHVVSHTHSFEGQYSSNDSGHYKVCECGEKSKVEAHDFEETTVDATCKEEGLYTKVCKVCGYKVEETLPKLNHDFELVEKVDSTEDKTGVEKHYECKVCHGLFDLTMNEVTLEDLVIEKKVHTHDYQISYVWANDNSKCTATKECSSCHDKITEVANVVTQVINEATCTAKGKNKLTATFTNTEFDVQTKEVEVNAKGHTYGALVTATESTCDIQGVKTHYECSACHKYFNEQKVEVTYESLLLPYAHELSLSSPSVPETCTTDGTKEVYTCSKCSKEFIKDGDNYILKTNENVVIPTPGHVYTALIAQVEPTCGSTGTKAHYECENCELFFIKEGNTYKEIEIDELIIEVLPHASLQHILDTDPTCTEVGYYECYYCNDCKAYFKDANAEEEFAVAPIIEPLGHDQVSKVDEIAAECEKSGNIEFYICKTCNKVYTDSELKNEITIEETVTDPIGHAHDGYKYELVKDVSKVYDSTQFLVVAKVGSEYYATTMNANPTNAEKATYKNGYLYVENPMPFTFQRSVKGFKSGDSGDATLKKTYSIYFASDYAKFGTYLGSSSADGSYVTNASSTQTFSMNWQITMDATTGETLLQAGGTNKYSYWLFNTSTKKFGARENVNASNLKVYLYRLVSTDINTVRVSDTKFDTYYKCSRCGCNYTKDKNRVSVSSSYQLLKGSTNTLVPYDKFIIANNANTYAVSTGVNPGTTNPGTGNISLSGKIKNEKITNTTDMQIFVAKPGYINTTIRVYRNNTSWPLVSVNTSGSASTLFYSNSSVLDNSINCMKSGSMTFSNNANGGYKLYNDYNKADKKYYCICWYETGSDFEMCTSYSSDDRLLKIYRQVYSIEDAIGDLVPRSDPTCTENGMIEHYYVDGTYYNLDREIVSYESLVIPMIGHNFADEYEHVFGTETHQRVCLNDPSHLDITPCEYEGGICKYCGSEKSSVHIHAFNLKRTDNKDTLVSDKSCTSYAIYNYVCSCGAIGNATFEDTAGGKLPHTLVKDSLAPTCTVEGYTNRLSCSVCGYVDSTEAIVPAKGHNYNNGDFTFKNIDSYTDTTGTWKYVCQTCKYVHTVAGDMTTRPGSSDYAYYMMAEGKFYNGKDFYLGDTEGLVFPTYNLGKYGQYFYKQLFVACEAVLDSNKDYDSGYWKSIKMPAIKTTNIPDGLTNAQVAKFLRCVCEWFKSDHPEYYWLSADKYSYGASTGSTTKSYTYSPYMYQAFWKAAKRKEYEAGFDNAVKQYQNYYLDLYPDENKRASMIFKLIMGKITYTYAADGATAPNTILPFLDGKGVCESYALSFIYIARMNGLEMHEAGSSDHAWVYGRVNGKWYQFDPTWGDGSSKVSKYYGFLKASDVDSADHHNIKGKWMAFPAVATTKLSYLG